MVAGRIEQGGKVKAEKVPDASGTTPSLPVGVDIRVTFTLVVLVVAYTFIVTHQPVASRV